MGFEAPNLTQVPLQPACTHSRLKSYPLSNKLTIVTALGQWPSLQSEKIASLPEMEALHAQKMVSKPVCAQEERSGTPSADQGHSTAKPRSSHVTWAQGWNPPTSPCPTLSARSESKSQGHCWKWHHKLKVVWRQYVSITYDQLNCFDLHQKYYRYGPSWFFQSWSRSFFSKSLAITEPIIPTTSYLLLYIVNYRVWLLLSHCMHVAVLNWSQSFSMTQVVTTETP